jgi:hypothetical protein
MRFKTTLELAGKTATGFRIPPDIVESFGKGKRPPVLVTINGYTYRNTVAVYDDEYLLGVSAEHRAGAGIEAGQEIEVDLQLDTAPRTVEVPPDLAAALDEAPDAQRAFDGLSYSNRRRITLSIEDAKTPETRQRRIDKAIGDLKAGSA